LAKVWTDGTEDDEDKNAGLEFTTEGPVVKAAQDAARAATVTRKNRIWEN